MGKASVVGGRVRLVVGPARVVGLFPFDMYRGVYYCRNKLMFVLSVALCLLHSALTVYLIIEDPAEYEGIRLATKIDQLDALLMNAVSVVALYDLLSSEVNFNDYLQALEEAEETLERIGHRVALDSPNGGLWIEACLLLFLFVFKFYAIVFVNRTAVGQGLLSQLYYLFLLVRMMAATHLYYGLLCISSGLFRSLGECIGCRRCRIAVTKPFFLEELVLGHHKLCLYTMACSAFQMPHVLLVLLSSFIVAVSESYKVYTLLAISYSKEYLVLLVKFSWIGACSHLMLKITTICKTCTYQAKEFNTILYQFMINDKTNDICSNDKLRLHIAMKREIVFSACGLFNLDYTLVHSMIAAATTYLVILVQYGLSNLNDPTNSTSTNTSRTAPQLSSGS